MGFNTTVLILNDGLDQLKKHPEEFVQGIVQRMHDGGDVSVGNSYNPVYVMPTEHADVFRLYVTQGNAIIELSEWAKRTKQIAERQPEYIRQLIDDARLHLDRLEEALNASLADQRD